MNFSAMGVKDDKFPKHNKNRLEDEKSYNFSISRSNNN